MSHSDTLRNILGATFTALALAPGLALAHSEALLSVDNRFDGEAEVYVDGRFQGMVAGDSRSSFEVRSGCHEVTVKRQGSGFVLASTRLTLSGGTTTLLPVAAPRGRLQVKNTGDVSLKLDTEDIAPVWVSPGATAILDVEAGNVALHATIRSPMGEWEAMERALWVEPGTPTLTNLKPDPTVLVISNRERFSVHAVVEGIDLGWIDPGESQSTWIRAGNAQVVLLDRQGRVRLTTAVAVRKGAEAIVALTPPPPSQPVVVVSGARTVPSGAVVVQHTPGISRR